MKMKRNMTADAAVAFNQSRAFYRRFLEDMANEIDAATLDFPDNREDVEYGAPPMNDTPSAFGEEVGEVFKAINDYKRAKAAWAYGEAGAFDEYKMQEELYWECVQAAAMALRIAHEGVAAL